MQQRIAMRGRRDYHALSRRWRMACEMIQEPFVNAAAYAKARPQTLDYRRILPICFSIRAGARAEEQQLVCSRADRLRIKSGSTLHGVHSCVKNRRARHSALELLSSVAVGYKSTPFCNYSCTLVLYNVLPYHMEHGT